MDNTSSNQKERWSTFSFFHFIILSHHGKLFQKGRKEKEAKEIFLGINKRNKFILRGEKLDALPTFRQSQTSTISIVIDEILQGAMGQEMRFEKSALYDEDIVSCSCGFLQFLGFRCRIGKAIDPGSSYSRLHNSDSEVDSLEDRTSLSIKEKDHVAKPNSYRRNIKAWIKRRINKRQNKKQKLYPGTTQLSCTNAIRHSKFNQTSGSIKELGRTLLDGLLHRIPYGQKVPEEMIKEKLCRSLSADYDAYTKRGKKSSISVNANQDNKFRRIYSSPASVTEKKFCDTTNGIREEEMVLNSYHEKDAKCDVSELVQENNKTDAPVYENGNGMDKGMGSTGEPAGNMVPELSGSKENAIDSGVTCNMEFEKKEEKGEKIENDSTLSEIKDVGPMEPTILQVDIGKKDLCIDPKELECLTNLLLQLGFDMSLGTNEETTHINAEEDDATPILDSEVSLEEFKRAWDQINKVEFAKFDCNILPQDLILVLDLIDQAYTEAYNNCSSSFVWFSTYVSKLSPNIIENHILKVVQERVTWYLRAHEECSDEADDLVAWDYGRYDEWLDRRADFEKIVVELEKLVLDDLVEGLVVEEDGEVRTFLRY